MALVRATAAATINDEYDVRAGIEWTGDQPLTILTVDNAGIVYDGASTPLHRHTPVEATVDAGESDPDYHWRVHDLAQDCVNLGGIWDDNLPAPTIHQAGQRGEPEPVCGLVTNRPGQLPTKHNVLVPQHEKLRVLG